THTHQPMHAILLHGLHNMRHPLRIHAYLVEAERNTEARQDGILSFNCLFNRCEIEHIAAQHLKPFVAHRKCLGVAGDSSHCVSLGQGLFRQELSGWTIRSKYDQFHCVTSSSLALLPLTHFSFSGFPMTRISDTRPASSVIDITTTTWLSARMITACSPFTSANSVW